jgi:hypothetical protein
MTNARTTGLWTTGTFTISATLGLDPSRRYLLTGALPGVEGDDYGQIYTSVVCYLQGDTVLCGIRAEPSDSPDWKIKNAWLNEVLSGAESVTVTLDSTGGRHHAEIALIDLS